MTCGVLKPIRSKVIVLSQLSYWVVVNNIHFFSRSIAKVAIDGKKIICSLIVIIVIVFV
jgi:hypothetical protein